MDKEIKDIKGNTISKDDLVKCGDLHFVIEEFKGAHREGDLVCGKYGCFASDFVEKVDVSFSIKEFCKLFKVTIPVEKYFDYYIDTLSKSQKFSNVKDQLRDYKRLEVDAVKKGYKNAKSMKLDYALPKLKKYIMGLPGYKDLIEFDYSKFKFFSKNELKANDDTYLISIDFSEANFNAMKHFCGSNDLGSTWPDLCFDQDIHPVLCKSKSFRQVVFGNTNPNRLQKIQHMMINEIINKMKSDHGISEEEFVFISHDEMILKLRPESSIATSRIVDIMKAVKASKDSLLYDMPVHFKVFKNTKVGKGIYVQTNYNAKLTGLSETYKNLFGVPGSKFFKYFKQYVLEEPIDNRDLMFVSDGDIAFWNEHEDSIDGIISDDNYSLEEIKKSHKFAYDKLREISGLSDNQIKKVFNVMTSVCKYCYNEDGCSCNCWNDE